MSAVADLLAHPRPRAARGEPVSGLSPQVGWQRVFGGQVIGQALVAACRTVDVAGGRRIRCTPISCSAATRRCRSSTRSTASATARASPPAAWSRSSTARRSSPCRCRSIATSPGSSHQAKMPDVPTPGCTAERGRDQGAHAADDAGAGAALLRARTSDRTAAGRIRPLSRQADRRRPLQRLDPRHRRGCRTTRRSINACSPMPPT